MPAIGANKRALAGMGMVVFAAMLWGTTGTAQTLVPAGLPAHWVGALRLLFSGVFFVAYACWQLPLRQLQLQLAETPWRWVLLGGAGMAAYNLTFFAGVKASSVAIGTAIALGSGPIFAGLLQILLFRRSPTGPWWAGTLLAVAGGTLMVLGSAQEFAVSVTGVGLCLISGLSYAAYTLVSKHMVARTPPSVVTLCIFVCAAAIAVPVAFVLTGLPATTLQGWWVVVYLGIAATGVAYLFFTHALHRISSGTAVSLCLMEPLTAFCLAILVIGERPPLAAFAGLALVMLGLVVVVRAEMGA